MDFHEYIVYYLFVFVAFYALYRAYMYIEEENRRLKDRNSLLAYWLQTAELYTGTPYYSAIAVGAVPFEQNTNFSKILQMRVQNMVFAVPSQPHAEDTGGPAAHT